VAGSIIVTLTKCVFSIKKTTNSFAVSMRGRVMFNNKAASYLSDSVL